MSNFFKRSTGVKRNWGKGKRMWREDCANLPLSHMGRGADDDPDFFAAAFAAGRLARSLLT